MINLDKRFIALEQKVDSLVDSMETMLMMNIRDQKELAIRQLELEEKILQLYESSNLK